MTKEERESMAIAKALVKALERIEGFDGDPSMILTDAEVFAVRVPRAKPPLEALRQYYEEL